VICWAFSLTFLTLLLPSIPPGYIAHLNLLEGWAIKVGGNASPGLGFADVLRLPKGKSDREDREET
jgi:hypothetical protein